MKTKEGRLRGASPKQNYKSETTSTPGLLGHNDIISATSLSLVKVWAVVALFAHFKKSTPRLAAVAIVSPPQTSLVRTTCLFKSTFSCTMKLLILTVPPVSFFTVLNVSISFV